MSTHAPSPAEVEHIPLPPEAFTVALIDQSHDVREFARDAADTLLTEELNGEGGRFRKMVRNIWKGNLANEYYRQQYIQEARGNILEESTLYANRGDVETDARVQARNATMAKFIGDYEGAIHTDAGEKRKDVTEAQAAGERGASAVADGIKGLIQAYAEGHLDDDSLGEERTRLLGEFRRTAASDQLFGEGVMVADNILEIAQNVRAAITHGESMDRVMENIRIISGESRSGARTEAQHNKADKVIERINGSKLGCLANETTVATAVSVAASLARFGSTKAVTAAAMTVVPGVGAGVIAGVRENKRVKDERRQHAREMATGQEYDRGNAKRRDAMQETVYETATAQSLIEDLAVQVDAEALAGADEARMREALTSLLNTQSRIKLSDVNGMDLISFSSVSEVESERLLLDIALARAKVTFQAALADAGEAMRTTLGFEDTTGFSENLSRLGEAQQIFLEQDISDKDAAFKSLQRREVAKTAAKAALIGVGMGMVAQEIKAMIDPSTKGLVEQLWHSKNKPIEGRNHETLLHGFFGKNQSPTADAHIPIFEHHALSGQHTEHVFGHGTKVSLSSEYKLDGGNGHYQLVGPTGKHVTEVTFNKDGALTQSSLASLHKLGLSVNDKSFSTTELVPTTHAVNVTDYLAHNQPGTNHVTRDLWYDNNTPKFDQNELRMWWGGTNNSGIDAHGNFTFSVSPMTPNGSFHNAAGVDWHQAAASGQLKVVFSATRESQNHVFSVAIGPDGQAIIPKGSPIEQMFTMQNGHAVFQGKYAEVVQSMGVDQKGVEHIRMLATEVGQDNLGSKAFTVVDNLPHTTMHHVFEITGKDYTTVGSETIRGQLGNFVEMAPVIPVYSRKGLENILANEDVTPGPYYYRGAATPEEVAERRRHFSPRLIEDPEAKLDDKEEIEWYLSKQTPEHVERVRRNAESIKEPMGKDTKIVVTIPVAGHQESDNIYRTLSAYLDQTLPKDQFEVMLYVNHPVTDKAGNKLNAKATLAEIERFQRDHPEMPLRVAYEALPREKAKIGYIRKVLVDTVLQRQMDRETIAPLALVSNDADAIAINPKYLEVMLRKLDENDEHDAVVGQIDWDNKAYINYPEIHISTRLFQFFDISLRNKEGYIQPTSGANSVFRSATYAAVGGYDDSIDAAGEDVRLGRDMEFARDGSGRQAVGFGGVVASRIETSARRSIYTLKHHLDAPYNQWNYEFGADDDDIRAINVDRLEPQDFTNTEKVSQLVASVEDMVNKTLENLFMGPQGTSRSEASASVGARASIDEARAAYLSRAITAMGIEFEWEGSYGKIKITDASKMVNALHNYSIRAIRKDMIKQGVPTAGGFSMVNGQLRKANGQFMSKKDKDAIMSNLPRLFGSAAVLASE